jgi:hypothetical protein
MYIILSTSGQQAIMDAKSGGYLLTLGYVRLYNTGTAEVDMPLVLDTVTVDTNPQTGWTQHLGNITTIDEFNPVTPEVFQIVVNIPTDVGDFTFDAVAVYLSDNTLFGIGTYERLIDKVAPAIDKTGSQLELEIFIRHASIASVINVTRQVALRPYSRITEYANSDLLGRAVDNMERIYRVTRATNYLNDGRNNFTTFLVSAGYAVFDNLNKPYQREVWVPSDHLSMFGNETLRSNIINNNTVSVYVPKNTYPMIEHVVAEVPYLLATTQFGNNPLPSAVQGGLLLEAVLSTRIDSDPNHYEFVFQLLNTTFATGSQNQNFGVILYAANTDLSAQTAIKIALKKFLEMQYDIGRTYKSDQDTDPNLVLKPFLGYDTYWRKLDGIVEVATSTTDGRITSPGQLYNLPDYATGGGQILAPVLRATNIWLRYDPASSGTITYQLGADRTTVSESGTINVTLLTTGLTNGSLVAYTITGIQQADLSKGTLTGYFIINNNTATLAFDIAADQSTEGPEIFNIRIDAEPTVQVSVSINDTSATTTVQSFFALDPAASSFSRISRVDEGRTIYYIATVEGIADGAYLYPKINGSSADGSDLTQPIPVSVRVMGGRVSFPVTPIADRTTEHSETLAISLYRNPTYVGEDLLSTAVLIINDTSVTPEVDCFFYTELDLYGKPIKSLSVDEGMYVYLAVNAVGYAAGTTLSLYYPTDSVDPINGSDFATTRPTSVTLNSQGKATVAYFIANDNTTEVNENSTIVWEYFAVAISESASSNKRLAYAQIRVRDTSRLISGSFTLLDITDSENPVQCFNSESDQLSENDFNAPSGGGLQNKSYLAANLAPLDVCLMLGHKYRLIWIQGTDVDSAVTRAACGVFSGASYGVGLGNVDLNSATSGKALTMITDSEGDTLGYGAIFEFTIGSVNTSPTLPISQCFVINIYTYYPNGIPGLSTASSPTADKWAKAKQAILTHKENNDTVKIKNLYNDTVADWTTFCAKEITVPFGAIADVLIVLPSGSGATSSRSSGGFGTDGMTGHDFSVAIPRYAGKDRMASNNAAFSPDPKNAFIDLFHMRGGDSGKGQLFNGSLTNLGGKARSALVVNGLASSKIDTLLGSSTLGLFGKDENRSLDFDVVFEVLQVISGREWQLGRSTNADHGGGSGILPSGLSDVPTNYRGGGGKGGDSVDTGTGYGGGGSSGAVVHLRLGTKVNTAGFTPNATLAPVSFFVFDTTTIESIEGTDPLDANLKPFAKATTEVVSGTNAGEDGSAFYIAPVGYEADAKSVLDKETLIGTGTELCFVRPTHNAATFPTLPIRSVLLWNKQQLNQVTIPKFGISRITVNATGVEGEYLDGSSTLVSGLPSEPSNIITDNTVNPNTTATESVGNTFVYFAGASADTDGAAPVLDTTRLSTYQNLTVSNYRASNGTAAVANGDNGYSRGGFIDLYITNFNTKSASLFVELPRVDLSTDNPARISDTDNYLPDTWWSNTRDADGNAISSHNYMLADGDGALSVQPYSLSSIVSIRPWIPYGMKDATPVDKNAPIILQQGQAVTLTVVGGGGAISTRNPESGVTTPDPTFSGSPLILQVKGLSNNTYTTFLTCAGGTGSIDNTTNPIAAGEATYNASPLSGILTVIGTPELLAGTANPIKAVHGGIGSGSYAKITLLNQNPTPVTIQATGGKGGSGEPTLQISDGVVLVSVI